MCQFKEDKQPLVSIVAVCYNHEKFVEETLNSVIAQTYSQVELIIIDDCSADGSTQVINQWVENHKKGCHFIVHQKNKGLCASLNEALSYVNGKYLQIIACDDVLASTKIEKQVEYLEANSDDVLCCSDFRTIDESGAVIKDRYFPDDYMFPENPFRAILEGHHGRSIVVHSPTVLVKKNAIDRVGGYPENLLQEDFFMWLNLTSYGSVGFLSDTLVDYRKLKGSHSDTLSKKKRIEYLQGHLAVINDLLKRVKGENKQYLKEAKVKRIEKIAITTIKGCNADQQELDKVVSSSIKQLYLDNPENSQLIQRTIGSILLVAWKHGRTIRFSERKYLRMVRFRYRVPMFLGLLYRELSNSSN